MELFSCFKYHLSNLKWACYSSSLTKKLQDLGLGSNPINPERVMLKLENQQSIRQLLILSSFCHFDEHFIEGKLEFWLLYDTVQHDLLGIPAIIKFKLST